MQKPVIKALLFDLDDTLWPAEPVLQHAEQVLYTWLEQQVPHITAQYSVQDLALQRHTLMQKDDKYRINLWLLRHTALQELFRAHHISEQLADEAMAVFSRARDEVTLFDDVIPGLSQLHNTWKVGAITNGTVNLHHTGLSPYFDTSISAYKLGIAKPSPEIFLYACAQLDILPSEAVYIGDHLLLDVEGAQTAGLIGIWMNRFDRINDTLITPSVTCTNLFELHEWLISHTNNI